MTAASIAITTLVIYQLLLLLIGFWASKKTASESDFFLGGRGLGPLVGAISYSASASSAWTLLGISGIAYSVGVSALWVVLGSISGMIIAWFWVAPRLMNFTRRYNYETLIEFLAHDCDGRSRRAIVGVSAAIIVFSFTFYIAAQFQAAGSTFSSTFDLPINNSIFMGAGIILIYTMIGGFWAVSLTDTLQGLLMALAAVVVPIVAYFEVGGYSGFISGIVAVSTPDQLSFSAGNTGLFAIGTILGGLCVGTGTYGQPHLLVRFMALRDERAMKSARWITFFWYVVVFLGMYFLGLVGHILHSTIDNAETIFFVLTESLFPVVIGSILLTAVISAIMSTADSQLLVAATTLSKDVGLGRAASVSMLWVSRLTIVLLVFVAVLVAILLPEKIFSRVLFAWIALGSAFGPLVFVRLAGVSVQPIGVFLSILSGFVLAVILYLMPNTPGDLLERLLPFCVALGILWIYRSSDQRK